MENTRDGGREFLIETETARQVSVRRKVSFAGACEGQHGLPATINRTVRFRAAMDGRMPLSSGLSAALRLKLEEAADGKLVGREMRSLMRFSRGGTNCLAAISL